MMAALAPELPKQLLRTAAQGASRVSRPLHTPLTCQQAGAIQGVDQQH
jgi:hypothetical protein